MFTKKLAVVVALTALALLAPSAYADGDESDENASDPAAAQESADTPVTNVVRLNDKALFPLDTLSLFPEPTGRQVSPEALWSPVRMSRSASGLASSAASVSASPPVTAEDRWEIIFAPYLYLASLNGDMGVGRATSVPLDVRAGTILENFEFGFMGHFEIRKGRWGGMFDASYVELGASIPTTGAVIGVERITDVEFEQTTIEAFLSYRVYRSDRTAVDLFGGVRYWDMDLDLEITGPLMTEAVKRGERWADPVFGVRIVHFVSDRWFLPLRGDLGGFGGVGATSDFSWNLQGGVGFQANKHIALVMQYKALSVDFDNDKQGTADFFAFDAIQHGPVLGFVFKF
jgi:hypothetical protein